MLKVKILVEKKEGKREYINNIKTRDLIKELEMFFESTVEIPRMNLENRQTVETLINVEALLLARFLRNERKKWIPRIVIIN